VIHTLLVTIIVEGALGLGYSIWRRKPVAAILITGIFANLLTQSFLWVVLNFFFSYYLTTLLLAEILIWMIESLLLYSVPANRLRFNDAILLSLSMNLGSFALGWFLAI